MLIGLVASSLVTEPDATDTDLGGLSRDALIDEVMRARRYARDAEMELGNVRGDLAEMHVQLIRARQDQAAFQVWFDRLRTAQRYRDGALRRARRRLGRT